MRQNRVITAFLIAMWLLTPGVLCLLPGVSLTMDEHECCDRMAGHCGNVPMPDLHRCCETVTASAAVITAKAASYPHLQVATLHFVNAPPALMPEVEPSASWPRAASASPPSLSSHKSIDILRI